MLIYSEAGTLSRLVTYESDHCIKCQDIGSKFMSVIETQVQELVEENRRQKEITSSRCCIKVSC